MDISLLIKSKIEKLCQCAICLELLKQPRTLVCQHTFCQKCLMLTCIRNRMGLMSLFCPTCRQRQPLVFRTSDVAKLQTPYFLNQLLEILHEWMKSIKHEDSLKKDPNSSLSMINPDFMNTKITSVFKTINTDTLEQMTRIRTDEFGLQSVKVRKLEHEIAKSKLINSELLVNNYIMKTKLEKQNTPSGVPTFFTKKHAKNKTGQLEDKINRYATKKIDLEDSLHDSFEKDIKFGKSNKSNNKDISKIPSRSENQYQEDPTCYSQRNISSNTTNVTADKTISQNQTKVDTKIPNFENAFCWRCMRRGHSGNTCKETSTVLGRSICVNCDMVGHQKSQCHFG